MNILFPGTVPELSSESYLRLLREVPQAQAGIRLAVFVAGCLLCLLVVADLAFKNVRVNTVYGYVFLVVVLAMGGFLLGVYSVLKRDIKPYQLSAETLKFYTVAHGKITRFGTWFSFGGGALGDRYQKVYWVIDDGGSGLQGETPLISGVYSKWFDLGDVIYVAIDKSRGNPPVFLGLEKAAPPPMLKMLESPPDLWSYYTGLAQHLETSRRDDFYIPPIINSKTKQKLVRSVDGKYKYIVENLN